MKKGSSMQLAQNPKEAIKEIIEATRKPRIEKIQSLLAQIDKLKSEIEAQKSELKSDLIEVFANIEKEIQNLPEPKRQEALQYLQECKLNSLEFLGILAETTESAILTTLENGQNIKETISEITKDLTYQTIDINVDPKHIKDVTKTIFGVATTIAQASINHADEILEGALIGIKQGIKKSIQKFNETIEFTPDEARAMIIQNYEEIVANLGKIDEIYLQTIQEVAKEAEPGIKEKILQIAKEGVLEKIAVEAQNAINLMKKSFETITPTIKASTDEAKKLGLRAFEIAREKIEETLNAIKK